MKNLILLLLAMLPVCSIAQKATIKTETISVLGNCDDCKERIENAADIKGVKICKWDPDTRVATVTYNPEKVSLDRIMQAIAESGYDAGSYKGNQVAYDRLPQCCKYRDGKCEEPKK